MTLAALFISGREWILPALLLLLAAVVVLVWSYRAGPTGSGVRAGGVLLKLLGLAALGFCLLEPLWTSQRARPGANFFAVVADNSQSLQIKDAGQPRSRGEVLRETLNSEKADWMTTLAQNFQVRRYLLDARLLATRDFSDLQFDGRASALGSGLRSLADRFQGQPLAGVLLFSDGNATDLTDSGGDWSQLPPVYPVMLGTEERIRDIAVQKVAVSQTAFEDAPVTIDADVQAVGFAGVPLVARLTAVSAGGTQTNTVGAAKTTNAPPEVPTGKVLAEQTQESRDGEMVRFRFQIRPTKPGVSFYRVQVAARGEFAALEQPGGSGEASVLNNSRTVVVDRGRGPYRILYVSGRPNWEFKFLNRAVAEDDQVQLVALIRIAKREPKFEFKGNAGDSSNPLFKGFDKAGEEAERYDKPVLVRLNTRDEAELRGGFPKTVDELFGYHAVILDDLEAEFFTHDQQVLLQKFVSERGGGLLMLGGMESLHEGKFARTPIGDVLPVYLDRAPETGTTTNLQLSLTREGWLQPWARLRSNEADEKQRLAAMPGFDVVNRVRGLKPGASVIANVSDGRNEIPALAVQRFGRGRGATLMVGDFWRWGMLDESTRRDLDKAWRQMMRWLVADVPNRVELLVEPRPNAGQANIDLQARVRDEKFQPLDNASVKVTVRPVAESATSLLPHPGGGTNVIRVAATNVAGINLDVESGTSEPGLYHTTFVPRETGGYLAEVTVTDASGVEVGRAEAGWTSDPAADEFRSLQPNRALLEMIARQTGGEVVPAKALDSFAAGLPMKKAPIVEASSFPLWHTPALFVFALLCFVAEWGLRRWKGMA